MKIENIYVGIDGATFALQKGKAVAALPPRKGEKSSFMLLESGEMVRMSGTRIQGVTVAQYLKEHDFELAAPGDSRAGTLANLVDAIDGISLVQAASVTKAKELQEAFAGLDCTFVPFDEKRPCVAVKVEASNGIESLVAEGLTGFSSGGIRIEFDLNHNLASSLTLTSGWLVGQNGDASRMPRNTEYGGIVEQAVYTICNCGLGTLYGEQNLQADSSEAAPYRRGLLKFVTRDDDVVQVGVTADDQVEVIYRREGQVLYKRPKSSLPGARLAQVIGAIAAVMVRVHELDARATKKPRKKAA